MFESILLQQTVGLSLDFSFLYRKAGGSRGVRGPGQAECRQRRAGLVNITPTTGNVSVGRFSSTALPARALSSTVVAVVRRPAQAMPSTVRCSCQPSGKRECASSLSAVRSCG